MLVEVCWFEVYCFITCFITVFNALFVNSIVALALWLYMLFTISFSFDGLNGVGGVVCYMIVVLRI